MDMGIFVTIVLTLAITIAFCLSAKRLIKKFIAGECCGASGCSSCGCACGAPKEK